ncbi:Cof-type HAD-IIB family hydrolase [Luteococcus sediminum]
MTITSIAIDLDGTLFTPERDYDRARFARMLEACEQRDIRVVIASGRQHLSMRTMFDEPDRLAFVGDNGSMVIDRDNEPVHAAVLDDDVVRRAVELLDQHPEMFTVASGPEGGWIQLAAPQLMHDIMDTAYVNLARVESLREIDGPVSKFALVTHDGQAERLAAELSQALDGAVVPVTTGHRGIDLIDPRRHKADGLGYLMRRWDRRFEDMVAFGDSGNDVEMLRAAGTSYAMAEAQKVAVEAADRRAPSGAESGVMVVMEELLGL